MNSLPKHVAIIMDGNGRWAKAKGLPRLYGHIKGAGAVDSLVDDCIDKGIKVLSIFAFGFENWLRPKSEVNALQKLFYSQLRKKIANLHKKGVCLRFIGDTRSFNEKLREEEKKSMELTRHNSTLILNIAVSYSGQWDICQASKTLIDKVQRGELSSADITPEIFQTHLSTQDLPMVDLFIRTSGECRISNFMLWQLAYAELYFTDLCWPEFSSDEFQKALNWFANRERRFGKISEQLQEKSGS